MGLSDACTVAKTIYVLEMNSILLGQLVSEVVPNWGLLGEFVSSEFPFLSRHPHGIR